jgi:hypothetical protein
MSDTDAQITALFKVVRTKQEEVAAAEKASKQSWKTNCTIHVNSEFVALGNGALSGVPINIQTASQDTIRNVVIRLLQIRDYSEKAEEILGLEKSTKHDGFTYDDWLTDCQKRITVLGLQAKKSSLASLEKRLDAIVSPDQRRAMELKAIAESLGIDGKTEAA